MLKVTIRIISKSWTPRIIFFFFSLLPLNTLVIWAALFIYLFTIKESKLRRIDVSKGITTEICTILTIDRKSSAFFPNVFPMEKSAGILNYGRNRADVTFSNIFFSLPGEQSRHSNKARYVQWSTSRIHTWEIRHPWDHQHIVNH